jgi:hypothetical protein
MVKATFWTVEEVVITREKIYNETIKTLVETPENIGKMLTIDVETGEYRIDSRGAENSSELLLKPPMAKLFTLKIGYETGVSFSGLNERNKV